MPARSGAQNLADGRARRPDALKHMHSAHDALGRGLATSRDVCYVVLKNYATFSSTVLALRLMMALNSRRHVSGMHAFAGRSVSDLALQIQLKALQAFLLRDLHLGDGY